MDKVRLRNLLPSPQIVNQEETQVTIHFKAMHDSAEQEVNLIFEVDPSNNNVFILEDGSLKKQVKFKNKVPAGSYGDLKNNVVVKVLQEPSNELELLGVQLKWENKGGRDSIVKSFISVTK